METAGNPQFSYSISHRKKIIKIKIKIWLSCGTSGAGKVAKCHVVLCGSYGNKCMNKSHKYLYCTIQK